MPKYRFSGDAPETFPSIVFVDADGHHTLTLEPGDVVDLPEPVEHPRLEATDEPATHDAALATPVEAPELEAAAVTAAVQATTEPPATEPTEPTPAPTVPDIAGHDITTPKD